VIVVACASLAFGGKPEMKEIDCVGREFAFRSGLPFWWDLRVALKYNPKSAPAKARR